ncbi:uncharacterized protein LOC126844276 isoform X2 [Adelges cooleyi]|nr:uncharacterized protein LOC126844276 isoform X2 [Adelges cooleyi]
MTYNTSPTFQRASMRLSAAYLNQIRRGETSKIAFRPRLNEQQRPRTSFILTSSDWARTKNVPVSSLQKIGTNYMQIPIIQKTATVLPARTSVDVRVGQPQRPQHQAIRSVILPSNYRTAMSPPRATDCRVLLNSINVPTQVLASTNSRPRIASVPVTSIQRYSTNYMSIPLTQKPATVLARGGPHPTIDNIRIGPQQHQTIRSLILPSNYRATMVSPRRGVDYRLILKPVNIQSQVLKNLPSPHHISSRQVSPPLPSSTPNRVPLTRLQNTRVHHESEIIASSKITPIPLKGRKGLLVISEGTIKMVINELNDRHVCSGDSTELTQEGIEIMQTEVSHKLFHLIRECKVMLAQLRTNVLTEEICREVCADFFTPFYGNKLWPLFCLRKKPFDKEFGVDDEKVWIRKHNIVNVVGWIKHPKFRSPSYIKKRILKKPEPNISDVPNEKKQSNEVTSTSSNVLNGKAECSNNTKTLSATKIVCAPLKIANKKLAGEIPHISRTIIQSPHGPLNILSRHSTYTSSMKSLNISQIRHTPITRPVGSLNISSRYSTSSPSRKYPNISHSSHVLASNTTRSITTNKLMPNRSIDRANNLLVTIPTMTGNMKVPRIILD